MKDSMFIMIQRTGSFSIHTSLAHTPIEPHRTWIHLGSMAIRKLCQGFLLANMLSKAPETSPLPMELACTTLHSVLPVLRAIFLQLDSMEEAFCGSDPNQWVLNEEMP